MIPAPNCGSGDICSIRRDIYPDETQITFVYQKRRFLYNPKHDNFTPPLFEIDKNPKLSIFQNAEGISLESDVDKLERFYGKNHFDIPVPSFLELFKEHAVAPFFVFQVFCVALWCLDEFWYYSLFNLFMLVAFEATVVFQRRTTMVEFRTMGVPPYPIYVHRCGEWIEIQTDELLPGDLVSITRSSEDSGLPCDLILIDGTAIVNEAMLSGESTPLLKESCLLRPGDATFETEGLDKNSILHGGTKVLQFTPPIDPKVTSPPDNGALAVVTKTGFETTQGSLVRVMIFSAERVSVGNKESLLFILFLLIFAIAASRYVWIEGSKMDRKQSKLLLDCVLIITSVVPPELPMELTMAVNTSLAALSKSYIYCTEPFRIPFAGRVDVCCFDKTGTLTGEDLVFEGLAGFDKNIEKLSTPTDVPHDTILVLASAHALVLLDDGETVGEPMEKATLDAIGWKVSPNDIVEYIDPETKELRKRDHRNLRVHKTHKDHVKILRRFQFSSALKRSSSISTHGSKTLVAAKGAPETIKKMLNNIPEDYEKTYKYFTRSGSRVLALGYKYLEDNISSNKISKIKREEVESNLLFAGFLVFHCPLKDDAIETIQNLNESSHRCVMITGDNPLTAVHVAKAVYIVERPTLILDTPEDQHSAAELIWKSVDEKKIIPVDPLKPLDESIYNEYDLCLTGHALSKLKNHNQLINLLKHTWVYARVSPLQKEFILTSLKNAGYTTLMCGDGTNDVGALKQANVGLALLNGTEEGMKKMAENRRIEGVKMMYKKQCDLMARWGNGQVPPVPLPISHLYPPGPTNPHYLKALENRGTFITDEIKQKVALAYQNAHYNQNQRASANNAANMANQLMSFQEENEDEAPTLKLGDASVAAPFTSKLTNVSSVTHVIRQGRSALVATIQMYKILALNCLVSAYSLSVLYLAGIKFGDGQATASGVLLSICFLSISRAKTIEKLSPQRPQPGIFNTYIMGSIMGQFIIHIVSLIYIRSEVYKIEPRGSDIDLDANFSPSLLNTAIFLLQLAQNVSTFAVNYQGRPFRESLTDNKGMYYGLLGVAFMALAGSTEFFPEMNEMLKFVKMEYLFKIKLTTTLLFDYFGSWAVELFFKYFFADFKPSDIARREPIIIKSIEEKKND